MAREVGRIPQDDPLAFFLTWTTYGTWLPGDDRGWVAKPGESLPPDEHIKGVAHSRLTEPPLILEQGQRQIVESTISEHYRVRGWCLHAVACRSNHVHVVVSAGGRHPEEVMDQFKAWCTRKLKERDRTLETVVVQTNWWTQRGSKRWINDETSLTAAICYVKEGQACTELEKCGLVNPMRKSVIHPRRVL